MADQARNTAAAALTEKHIRRVLWRDLKLDEEPQTYGFDQVQFGDKPAAAICAAAVKETCDVYGFIDEDAAEKIREDSYVDDIVTGSDNMQRIEEIKTSMREILSKTGFKIKGFIVSGDKSKKVIALIGSGEHGRFLGVVWDPSKDELYVTIKINLSKKQSFMFLTF